MNPVDILVVLGLSLFAFRGYMKGFVDEFLSFLAVVAAFVAAFRWTGSLAPRLAESMPGPAFVDTGVSFLLLFGLTLTTGRYVATTVRRQWSSVKDMPSNRLAGASFGIFKGAVVMGCTLLALRGYAPEAHASDSMPAGAAGTVVELNSKVEVSYLAARLADLTGGIFSAFMGTAEQQVRSLASGGAGSDAEGP